MYQEDTRFQNPARQQPIDGLPISSAVRPKIPKIFTPSTDNEHFSGHADAEVEDCSSELSRQLLSGPGSGAAFVVSSDETRHDGLPTSFSRDDDARHFLGYGEGERVDQDQLLSRQLLLGQGPETTFASSAPEPPFNRRPAGSSPLLEPSPLSTSFSLGDVSMSPAAMFLSTFSPAASLAPLPDDEGEQVAGYTLGPTIGYGGFSTIRKGTSPSGGIVAIKIVRRADVSKAPNPSLVRERLDNETAIWETLSHEHILPLFRSVYTPYADFFIMPYCPAGTLYDILKRDGRPALPHDDAGMMFRQVVRGLRYMHEEMGLVHGDIKLENVLVDEMGVCKIGDFGMTRRIGVLDNAEDSQQQQQQQPQPRRQRSVTGEHMSSIPHRLQAQAKRQGKTGLPIHLSLLRHHSGPRHRNSSPLPSAQNVATSHAIYEFQPGSLPYASPELLRPPSASHPYQPNPAQDIWALGVMLYALLTGRLPFMDSFEPRLQMKILHGVYDMPPGIGRGAELVLQGCLEQNVAQRWTIVAVDELSWSVDWPCPADKEIDLMVFEAPQSRSRSKSRGVVPSATRGVPLEDEGAQAQRFGRASRAQASFGNEKAAIRKGRETKMINAAARLLHIKPHNAQMHPSSFDSSREERAHRALTMLAVAVLEQCDLAGSKARAWCPTTTPCNCFQAEFTQNERLQQVILPTCGHHTRLEHPGPEPRVAFTRSRFLAMNSCVYASASIAHAARCGVAVALRNTDMTSPPALDYNGASPPSSRPSRTPLHRSTRRRQQRVARRQERARASRGLKRPWIGEWDVRAYDIAQSQRPPTTPAPPLRVRAPSAPIRPSSRARRHSQHRAAAHPALFFLTLRPTSDARRPIHAPRRNRRARACWHSSAPLSTTRRPRLSGTFTATRARRAAVFRRASSACDCRISHPPLRHLGSDVTAPTRLRSSRLNTNAAPSVRAIASVAPPSLRRTRNASQPSSAVRGPITMPLSKSVPATLSPCHAASTASTERTFSQFKIIHSALRNRLSHEKVRKQTLIREDVMRMDPMPPHGEKRKFGEESKLSGSDEDSFNSILACGFSDIIQNLVEDSEQDDTLPGALYEDSNLSNTPPSASSGQQTSSPEPLHLRIRIPPELR
ncbi:hypothetical protein EVG20_g883 [Dentipellis fragilis]|uniref:Protein kinase domain-containing protein n=1 Tax=Dentipellis fragilis TaxID=205917 RepID=A0A4Y9ZBE9_9AGAM|nr:hypothetical protein EVG20_g883 [Dentipellis fragilis]